MIQRLSEISAPTHALSGYIAGALKRKLPREVAERGQSHILDTLAAMVSGSRLPPGRVAIAYVQRLGGTRDASVAGSRILTSTVNAALANGMLAHADETDDSHAPSRNHPGCAVVPAALAAAEAMHASGEKFLRAVVLGYDVAARANYAIDAEPYAFLGRMTHSVGGTFGAGAAAGALMGVNEAQARHLLSYCAQQASGVGSSVRDADHIEKAFDFGGMPARNGMTAASMVAAGFTGVEDVFAGERNYLDAFAANARPEELTRDLGVKYEILGTNIKKWSIGSPSQAAIDALLHLMQHENVSARAIEAITVHLPTGSDRTVDHAPSPDVNVQHLLAMLLIDGTLTFQSTHDYSRMRDRAVLALVKKIKVLPSDELLRARPRRQAIVDVKLSDGRQVTHRIVRVRGTADNPMSRDEVEAKARDLLVGVIGPRRTATLIETVRDLAAVKDMAKLRGLWQAPTPGGKR